MTFGEFMVEVGRGLILYGLGIFVGWVLFSNRD